MALPSVITRMSTGTYAVSRLATSWVKGRATTGADTPFNIVAVVQPLDSRDRFTTETTGNGLFFNDTTKTIYTETVLQDGSPAIREADSITIDGDAYKVFHVEKWDYRGSTYYKAFASKEGT